MGSGIDEARSSPRLSGGNQQRVNIAIGLLSRPLWCCCSTSPAWASIRASADYGSSSPGLAGGGTTVIFSTHDIQEAERYGKRPLVLADGEALFDGSAEELREAVRREAPEELPTETSRPRSSPTSITGGIDALAAAQGPGARGARRWTPAAGRLPHTDLACWWVSRSPRPEKPRVAFLNQIPSGTRVTVGGQRLPSVGVDERICRWFECVRVKSRREGDRSGPAR